MESVANPNKAYLSYADDYEDGWDDCCKCLTCVQEPFLRRWLRPGNERKYHRADGSGYSPPCHRHPDLGPSDLARGLVPLCWDEDGA